MLIPLTQAIYNQTHALILLGPLVAIIAVGLGLALGIVSFFRWDIFGAENDNLWTKFGSIVSLRLILTSPC